MPGHTEFPNIHDVLWADAEIQSISIDYHSVTVALLEATGRTRAVRCRGYIGYQLVGFWDEIVVERAELSDADPFLDQCRQQLRSTFGKDLPPTGDEFRNQRSWSVLSIHLADGTRLLVAAADFSAL
jgi:hypothetical protein